MCAGRKGGLECSAVIGNTLQPARAQRGRHPQRTAATILRIADPQQAVFDGRGHLGAVPDDDGDDARLRQHVEGRT